jgi:CRP/FNR family transcriptional regulator, cyclic AMP receptor protein
MADPVVKTMEAGVTIFREGDAGSEMYILKSGAVELRKKTVGGETLLKTIDQANGFFGEMTLIDGKPRSATAVATKQSTLLVVTAEVFEKLILTNGEFALKVITILADRIRASNLAISELVVEDVKDRFCQGAASYARRFGVKIYDGSLKVEAEGMIAWIVSHVGLSKADTDLGLGKAMRQGEIEWAPSSAKTKDFLVIPESFISRYERRQA